MVSVVSAPFFRIAAPPAKADAIAQDVRSGSVNGLNKASIHPDWEQRLKAGVESFVHPLAYDMRLEKQRTLSGEGTNSRWSLRRW